MSTPVSSCSTPTISQNQPQGAASGEEAGARVGSALDELAQSFREAYAPVDCD